MFISEGRGWVRCALFCLPACALLTTRSIAYYLSSNVGMYVACSSFTFIYYYYLLFRFAGLVCFVVYTYICSFFFIQMSVLALRLVDLFSCSSHVLPVRPSPFPPRVVVVCSVPSTRPSATTTTDRATKQGVTEEDLKIYKEKSSRDQERFIVSIQSCDKVRVSTK